MASRQEYTTCVAQGMRGKKLSRPERNMEFCIVAKLCSKKAKDREEAKLICSQPKEPKPVKASRKVTGQSCEKEVLDLAHCMAEHIDMNLAHNVNSIEVALVNSLMECRCGDGH
jgi:hypothetical protein